MTLFMDVDTALGEVPVNLVPLTDDTDFKTIETGVAYNASGMALYWHFVTTAGVETTTAVTPTTGGTYDWAHAGQGMYTIEIPASGGASINNDTEGFGYFTGYATGVLPWRGPTICFRAAALNDALIDGGDNLDVNVAQWLGTAAATPTVAGVPEVDITHIAGSAVSTSSAQLGVNVVQVSGDSVAADNAEAFFDGTGYAGTNNVIPTVTTLTGHTPQTGDSYARLGAPAGASVSADIAAAKADTAAILLDTGTDGVVVAAGSKTGYSLSSTGLDAIVSTATGVVEVAKGVWDRVLSAANHNIANSAGRRLRQLSSQIVEDGTAQAGATASITLEAGASSVDNYYNLDVISIVDGTGAGQSRMVLAYNGTTKVATVYRDWSVNPDNTSVYVINAKTELLVRNSGLAAGGAANSITLNSTASSVNDNYVGETIVIAAGTGASQARVITAYNGTTKVATVTDAWATTPDTSSVYALLPLGRAYVIDLDADSLAKINAEVDTALADYDPPTRTEATSDANSILTRLGTPAGADVSTDIAAVKAETSAIVADTNELQTDWVNGGRLDLLLDGKPTLAQILAGGDIDGYTLEETLKLCLAALAGKLSGAATTTITFRAADDSANRIVATVDADGNRSAVTLNAAG